jgi:hypothetical protein
MEDISHLNHTKRYLLFQIVLLLLTFILMHFYAQKAEKRWSFAAEAVDRLHMEMTREEIIATLTEVPSVYVVLMDIPKQHMKGDTLIFNWPYIYRPVGYLKVIFDEGKIIETQLQNSDRCSVFSLPDNPIEELQANIMQGYPFYLFDFFGMFFLVQFFGSIIHIIYNKIHKIKGDLNKYLYGWFFFCLFCLLMALGLIPLFIPATWM